jgi:hypothetical protein
VFDGQGNSQQLYMAGDVEGHRGSDGRYYLLDLGRVLPPEHPLAVPFLDSYDMKAVFFRFFPPEMLGLLRQNQQAPPISSDSLSGWGSKDPCSKQHNQNCRDATKLVGA